MSRVLCIYPQDGSTKFLNRIQNHLTLALGATFHCYKVKPNQESHDECLERLRSDNEEELVLFLGHGRSDRLYGANSNYSFFPSPLYEGIVDYENDNFINRENLDVFRDRKVFCLSCNSADGLGKIAIEKGARVFIGFGDIPTDNEVLPELGKRMPLLIARFKGEVNWIVKTSLSHAIRKDYSFGQLVDLIRLLTNSRMNHIVLMHPGLRHRRLLADYLYIFKDGMRLFGNRNEKLLA
jgi:hypothetical protein